MTFGVLRAHGSRITEEDADALQIVIEATPWTDAHRAGTLADGSLHYADAIYVAADERHGTILLTADARIERSGAQISCEIITVDPAGRGDHYCPPSLTCHSLLTQ